jgi:hypothetical protein
MAAHQGFEYELNAAKVLKPLGIVPKNFVPAGSGSDQPDLMIKKPSQPERAAVGCELKITAASAGSLVLKYDAVKKKWGFNDISKDDVEKRFLVDLATKYGAIDRINKEWSGMPARYTPLYGSAAVDKKKAYEKDLKKYRDIKAEIPASNIEKYYLHKKTYYVNVGTHGLYLFGSSDPLKLSDSDTPVPRFGTAAKAIYRARVQYKGGGSYQFTFEMQFSISQKSPYNLAPVSGGTVVVNKRDLKLDCFL